MIFHNARIIFPGVEGRSVVVGSPEYQRLKASGNLLPRPEVYSLGKVRREAEELIRKNPNLICSDAKYSRRMGKAYFTELGRQFMQSIPDDFYAEPDERGERVPERTSDLMEQIVRMRDPRIEDALISPMGVVTTNSESESEKNTMWISPILAFDNYEEDKKYYKGIIEKTFKKSPFECSKDYSDECQKDVLAAYLMILACPKDSRNLMSIGLIKDADYGLCMLVNYSCDSIYAADYNADLLLETLGDDSYPFGHDEYDQINPKKPMWSFQNRRDYLCDVLSKHTTIPLETLKGLDGVKLPENPSRLVEWCKGALDGDFDDILGNDPQGGTPGLCYYSKWTPVGDYETVGMPMKTAMKVFLNPQLVDDTSGSSIRNEMYPFGGFWEYLELDNFKYPWKEPKRKAFLQRIVRYYEGQSDGHVIERSSPFQEHALIDHTKGIGDHQDYQTYLKERKEWCKGPKEYVEKWKRAYVYSTNVPQTVFANSFEPLYVKA